MQTNYISKGKELLKLLINNGFEGYFVGEAVRNSIMNIDFKRADIITNARIEDLRRINSFIFNDCATLLDNNVLKVVYQDYDFYFKSFSSIQSDLNDNRTKLTKHYSSNLLDELYTKDFTIDAIAMSYSGKITDAYNGTDDIKNKKIRTIVNPKARFNTYPLDMLEAFKIVSELKFQISDKTFQAIVKKSKLLLNVNKEDIYNYFKEILNNPYSKKALSNMMSGGIYKNIPSLAKGLKAASRFNKQISVDELLLASFVLNEKMDEDYLAYVENREIFEKIFNCAFNNKKAIYDPMTLFLNKEEVCLEANFINYLVGRDHLRTKNIKKDYSELLIKDYNELQYNAQDISRITNLDKDDKIINEILNKVVLNILNETLKNDYEEIERFVLKELSTKNIYFDVSKEEIAEKVVERSDDEVIQSTINSDYSPKAILSEDEENVGESLEEADDYTNHRLRMLEERLDEQDRLLQEKNERLQELENQKILEATTKLVNASMDLVKHDSQLINVIKDKENFELEYRAFILEYLEKENNKDEQ